MQLKKILIIPFWILWCQISLAQQSGNSVMGNNYHYKNNQPQFNTQKLFLNDSSFLIQARVLINLMADSYVATFGLSEAASALKEANAEINGRINAFIADLQNMGVERSDIYVDMTTQTEILDYKVTADYAEQFISGFEQKKNVVVRFTDIADLEKMIIIAAEHEIHDLVKVDYIVEDIEAIYAQLFEAAVQIINLKKSRYVAATNIKLKETSSIYGESFYSYYPKQLYRRYTPNQTTEFYSSSSLGKRKDLRKSTTYYYDPISYSGFDKTINPIITEPAVQFVLELQLKFDIE